MNLAREITGAIPTDAEASSCGIKMSHLFVACDGKTYIGHEWIERSGSSFSWGESYVPNVPVRRGTPSPQVVGSSCCFCQRTDGAVEIATTGTPMHRQCLRNAALGSLEAPLLPNERSHGSDDLRKM